VPTTAGLAGLIVQTLTGIQSWLASLPGLFAPFASLFSSLLSLPAALGLALLGGVAALAIYRLGMAFVWSPWDRRAKAEFAQAAATHSHARLAANVVANA
jgi:hypothetical protein